MVVAGYGLPTTLGPDSSGAVVAGTSGWPVVDEPETAAIAFSRWGCAAAVAESIYGFAAACAEARYCWPVAIADWTTPPLVVPLVCVVVEAPVPGRYD